MSRFLVLNLLHYRMFLCIQWSVCLGDHQEESTAVQPQWRYVWYAGLCLELCTSGPLLTMARCGDAEVLTNGRGVSARIMRPVSVQASGTLKLQKHTSLFGCPYCITWQFCLHASGKKYFDHVLLSATEFQFTPFHMQPCTVLGLPIGLRSLWPWE